MQESDHRTAGPTVALVYQSLEVPALLQTAEYARGRAPDPAATERVLAGQRMLLDAARQFHFVIAEEALRRPACAPSSMSVQMRYLASLSRLANVRLGILPAGAPGEEPPVGSFAVLDGHAVVTDVPEGAVIADRAGDAARYAEAFAGLAAGGRPRFRA
ncbi:MAG: Scr1 family TA system antitoxin-like transcriptional regulator, partial [Actinomycetota bacterium]